MERLSAKGEMLLAFCTSTKRAFESFPIEKHHLHNNLKNASSMTKYFLSFIYIYSLLHKHLSKIEDVYLSSSQSQFCVSWKLFLYYYPLFKEG